MDVTEATTSASSGETPIVTEEVSTEAIPKAETSAALLEAIAAVQRMLVESLELSRLLKESIEKENGRFRTGRLMAVEDKSKKHEVIS